MTITALTTACLGQTYGERVWTPPPIGTFYSLVMGGTNAPPFPFLPVDPVTVPVYSLGVANMFLIDDTESNSLMSENPPPVPGEGQGEDPGVPSSRAYDYGTNDLWLEIFPLISTNVPLLLHGVKSNYYYQLDHATSVATQGTFWTHSLLITNTTGTNQMPFEGVFTDGLPRKFFRAAEGYPLLQILKGGDAVEADGTNDNRTVGHFYVQLEDWNHTLSSNLTVLYKISGYKISASAENDTDYTNILGTNISGTNMIGTVVLPANSYQVSLDIDPKPDDIVEFCEFVTVTLIRANGYLVDPTNASATIMICDYFTPDVFSVVVTNVNFSGGIGYHPLSNSLIASIDTTGGTNFNFVQIYTNIVFTNSAYITNTIITNWSRVTDLLTADQEIKLAIAQTTTNGFTKGEMLFGTGQNNIIGKTSPDGTTSNLTWAIVATNQTLTNVVRGLHLDETGVFSNGLVAVSGGNNIPPQGGGVWELLSPTNVFQLSDFGIESKRHLEGVITLPKSSEAWGPWAGKLISGAETKTPPLVHTFDPNGVRNDFDMGIEPEDFDLIQTNQDLYCVSEPVPMFSIPERLVRLSGTLLTNYWGGLVIAQEGAQHGALLRDGKLFIVQWNATNATFVTRCIPWNAYFEHTTFAPISLPSIPQ
jgi:hypothetical protein